MYESSPLNWEPREEENSVSSVFISPIVPKTTPGKSGTHLHLSYAPSTLLGTLHISTYKNPKKYYFSLFIDGDTKTQRTQSYSE